MCVRPFVMGNAGSRSSRRWGMNVAEADYHRQQPPSVHHHATLVGSTRGLDRLPNPWLRCMQSRIIPGYKSSSRPAAGSSHHHPYKSCRSVPFGSASFISANSGWITNAVKCRRWKITKQSTINTLITSTPGPRRFPVTHSLIGVRDALCDSRRQLDRRAIVDDKQASRNPRITHSSGRGCGGTRHKR